MLLDNKKMEYPEISEPLSRRRQVSFLSRSAGSNVVAKEPFIEEFIPAVKGREDRDAEG